MALDIDDFSAAAALAGTDKFGVAQGDAAMKRALLSALLTYIAANIGTTFTRTILDDAAAGDVLTTLGVSAFIQTLLDDADAAAARNTLGLTHRPLAQSGTPIAHTGTTSETTILTVAIPSMAAGDRIEITHVWKWTSSANTKAPRIKFGGTTYHGGVNHTTTTFLVSKTIIWADSTSAQRSSPSMPTSWGTSAAAELTSAADTTGSNNLTFTAQLGDAGETMYLNSYSVEHIKKPF